MPLLYGEGNKEFIRLQEEILKQTDDESLFAWNPPDRNPEDEDAPEVARGVARAICSLDYASP